MVPTLIALAGRSRSGKGTCALVIKEVAEARGLTVCERQLSGPGKQYVASAFRPGIGEDEAIAWFEELKARSYPTQVVISPMQDNFVMGDDLVKVSLQQYLQRMLQGARDRWGEDFWTDKLLPLGEDSGGPVWRDSFMVMESYNMATVADVAIISDLRQVNEARRVKAVRGLVVELVRPIVEDSYVTGPGHVTERRLPEEFVDHAIPNDKTLDDLKQRAYDYFDKLLGARS